MFGYLGKFGQAVLCPSLPDRATKKKENCRSLSKDYQIWLFWWKYKISRLSLYNINVNFCPWQFQLKILLINVSSG